MTQILKNSRLLALRQFVIGPVVVDVGCDHGWLGIELLNSNQAETVIFADINDLPLANAEQNVRYYELLSRAQFIKSDGLSNIDQSFNTVVIAGIGGNLISQIINQGISKLATARLVLCPNNNGYTIRETLFKLGFTIENDEITIENNFFYEIIVASKMPQQKAIKPYTALQRQYGRYQSAESRQHALAMYQSRYDHLLLIAQSIPENNNKLIDINAEITKLNEVINEIK